MGLGLGRAERSEAQGILSGCQEFVGGVGRVKRSQAKQVAKRRLGVVCDSALWPSSAECTCRVNIVLLKNTPLVIVFL